MHVPPSTLGRVKGDDFAVAQHQLQLHTQSDLDMASLDHGARLETNETVHQLFDLAD